MKRREINHLRDVWQQLRWYQQGCSFEEDYRFIRSIAATHVIMD